MKRYYNLIREMDVSDGPGVRVAIYTQGCFHGCYKCFNKETWAFNIGNLWTEETNKKIIELMDKDHITGLSILGGDPLAPYDNRYEKIDDSDSEDMMLSLLKEVKEKYPEKTIWLWTGYDFEDFFSDDRFSWCVKKVLEYIDVVVDGKYMDNLKDLSLKYCGSTNQRVIDVKESFKENEIWLYED